MDLRSPLLIPIRGLGDLACKKEKAIGRHPIIVRQFVAKHIHSMDVLEILLLLRQEGRKEWEALTISKALHLQRANVEARLDQLLSVGLLTS